VFAAAEEYGIEIEPDPERVERLLSITPADVEPADRLTFARNVFVPLTTACRYTCTYCTYYDVPGEASLLSPEEVRQRCRVGADAGCTEALFTFGDEPDDRYTAVHDQLDEWGYDSILEYLYRACEIALEEGLLPHSNPGDLTEAAFADLREVNASMGVMLETTADVDAHSGGRRKTPGQRLNTIRAAGRQGAPTHRHPPRYRRGLARPRGEPARDPGDPRATRPRPRGDRAERRPERAIGLRKARSGDDAPGRRDGAGRAPEVSVQVPPNLSPAADLVDCGIDDLGGVSPSPTTTSTRTTRGPTSTASGRSPTRGMPLRERLPTYARFLPDGLRPSTRSLPRLRPADAWIPPAVRDRMRADDPHGRRLRGVARGDGPLAVRGD